MPTHAGQSIDKRPLMSPIGRWLAGRLQHHPLNPTFSPDPETMKIHGVMVVDKWWGNCAGDCRELRAYRLAKVAVPRGGTFAIASCQPCLNFPLIPSLHACLLLNFLFLQVPLILLTKG
jgi:hypothetical protein